MIDFEQVKDTFKSSASAKITLTIDFTQAYRELSSAKLQTSVLIIKRRKSLIIKKKKPRIEPCGTLKRIWR